MGQQMRSVILMFLFLALTMGVLADGLARQQREIMAKLDQVNMDLRSYSLSMPAVIGAACARPVPEKKRVAYVYPDDGVLGE